MKTVATNKLGDLFEINYGTKFDLKRMKIASVDDVDRIAFVSRSAQNLGIVAHVRPYKGTEPLQADLITVALGGTYLLSAFVQDSAFYTAQNVAVLTPKQLMTRATKLYYCLCIGKNRFKYSAFGREANRSLKDLIVPAIAPEWINTEDAIMAETDIDSQPLLASDAMLSDRPWKTFRYRDLFMINKGKRVVNIDLMAGTTPCIRPIAQNNGVDRYINLPPNHTGNTITVSYNGSVGEAFYQAEPYFALDDVNVLYPKFDMTPFLALFLIPLIRLERYRYNYGRKWNIHRMQESLIRLPVRVDGEPDWLFMEGYIKSLSFSAAV